MHVDEPPTEVVRVTVTDERQVLQEDTHIRDRGQLRGSQLVTIMLVVALHKTSET